MNSMVEEGHINNYFTMVLCGKGFNLSYPDAEMGGSLVSTVDVLKFQTFYNILFFFFFS